MVYSLIFAGGVGTRMKSQEIPKQFLEFRYLISTDLYLFKKNHVTPMSLSISPNGKYMSVFGLDWKVWV